jgi:hypothetical protein
MQNKLYNLRMKYRDSGMEHMNAFNTIVIYLLSIDINIYSEDKFIGLLCYLPR